MKGFFKSMVLLGCFLGPWIAHADELPAFLDTAAQEAFFPHGIKEWSLEKNITGQNDVQLQWTNAEHHEVVLKYRNATSTTVQGIYQGMGMELEEQIKKSGGADVRAFSEFFSVILVNDTAALHSVNLLYGTAEGSYLWTYRVPNTYAGDYDNYIKNITFAAREHQYNAALKYGNVIMGRWGQPIHEFAQLLAGRKDPRSASVYRHLLQTSPGNYEAHMEFVRLTDDNAEKLQSAKIILRAAEEESLLKEVSGILNSSVPDLSSYPLLSAEDKGLKVVLVPLAPCNPWVLEDAAKIYQQITNIPVVIRRLPVDWQVPEQSRSSFRPFLEKMASDVWKEKKDFNDWSDPRLKEELMKEAQKEGPSAVAYMDQIFGEMEKSWNQWEDEPMMLWLSRSIGPYFSKDPHTMVVGVTELDLYGKGLNFVFSCYGGEAASPVSVLSYARMRAKLTGESQSRARLAERAAKELVPASLKILEIPRSLDPACPYSYSSGLQRLDEKTTQLSDPVKQAIEKLMGTP